jgi:hypothetical protein
LRDEMTTLLLLTLSCEEAAPKHLEATLRLLAEVEPSATSYRHKNNVVRWKTADAPAECHADCSGLVNAVLLEATQSPAESLKNWFGAARPLAKHYYRAIAAEKRFRRIRKIEDVLPGDLLAIEYPAGNDNTGHVVIVAEKPVRQTPPGPPILENAVPWIVAVIDSTSSPHSRDTRADSKGAARSGLGKGSMRVYTDTVGAVVGHTWGLSGRSKYRPITERPAAFGRFDYAAAKGENRNPTSYAARRTATRGESLGAAFAKQGRPAISDRTNSNSTPSGCGPNASIHREYGVVFATSGM